MRNIELNLAGKHLAMMTKDCILFFKEALSKEAITNKLPMYTEDLLALIQINGQDEFVRKMVGRGDGKNLFVSGTVNSKAFYRNKSRLPTFQTIRDTQSEVGGIELEIDRTMELGVFLIDAEGAKLTFDKSVQVTFLDLTAVDDFDHIQQLESIELDNSFATYFFHGVNAPTSTLTIRFDLKHENNKGNKRNILKNTNKAFLMNSGFKCPCDCEDDRDDPNRGKFVYSYSKAELFKDGTTKWNEIEIPKEKPRVTVQNHNVQNFKIYNTILKNKSTGKLYHLGFETGQYRSLELPAGSYLHYFDGGGYGMEEPKTAYSFIRYWKRR